MLARDRAVGIRKRRAATRTRAGARLSPVSGCPLALVLAARRAASERQEADVAGALDRDGNRPLVPRAGAELAARLDLPALADVPAQARDVLVVDMLDVIDPELADLAARREATSAAAFAATARATATGVSIRAGILPVARSVDPLMLDRCRHSFRLLSSWFRTPLAIRTMSDLHPFS